MMINNLKLTAAAVLAVASIASPAFAQTAAPMHHRQHSTAQRPLYNYSSGSTFDQGPQATVERPFDPSNKSGAHRRWKSRL